MKIIKKKTKSIMSKVPELTFVFWLIKIAATTLGETGGDMVSMSMNLGYLVGTAIFAIIFPSSGRYGIFANDWFPWNPHPNCLVRSQQSADRGAQGYSLGGLW